MQNSQRNVSHLSCANGFGFTKRKPTYVHLANDIFQTLPHRIIFMDTQPVQTHKALCPETTQGTLA